MEENINLFRNYSQTYEEKVNEWVNFLNILFK